MAMLRARRLASVAVVASLAVAGLSACRSEPSVAAYVGASKITDSAAQDVIDDAKAKLGASAAVPLKKGDVVSVLLSTRVLGEVAKQQSLTLPADLSLGDYASGLHLPADSEYVRQFATMETYIQLLLQSVKNPPEPTDADLREVFDALQAAGQAGDATYEQFKSQLSGQNKQVVQTAAAARKEIVDVAGKMDIRLNPKYQSAAVPLIQARTNDGTVALMKAPLGTADTSPVIDVR